MSSADTRYLATAWGSFRVRSIATFAALKNFRAASLYAIAYSHRLRPVFQTFCLTSSPYLLKLFFFRKRRPRRLRAPFYKRDFALKSRNIAEDVVGLRVITLSVPHHCAHLNVTMEKKKCRLWFVVSHLRVLIFPQVRFCIPFDLVVHACSTMNFRRLLLDGSFVFFFKDVTAGDA